MVKNVKALFLRVISALSVLGNIAPQGAEGADVHEIVNERPKYIVETNEPQNFQLSQHVVYEDQKKNGVNKKQFADLYNAAECRPRKGLPNFFRKCKAGGLVKVAYLGGSITAQKGWRIQSMELFKKYYPKATFHEIYAAIGGTGSHLGAYRLERDVLRHKPDLLLVEFATNDGKSTTTQYMESIVRNTWKELPNCDICFVYTVAGKLAQEALMNGKCYKAATAQEKIANHYGIPSIHMGMRAAELALAGKLEWMLPNAKIERITGEELNRNSSVLDNFDGRIPFSKDGVHPYLNTGHILYTDAIARSLPKIEEVNEVSTPHQSLPAPLNINLIRKVTFLDVSKTDISGDWQQVGNPAAAYHCKNLELFVPSVWKGAPGATLSFKFTGKSIMLYSVAGPGCGSVELMVDGKKQISQIFDPWCFHWRLCPSFIVDRLDPLKMHTFKLTVSEKKFNKRDILVKYNREALFDKAPEKYDQFDVVLGGFFIERGTMRK